MGQAGGLVGLVKNEREYFGRQLREVQDRNATGLLMQVVRLGAVGSKQSDET